MNISFFTNPGDLNTHAGYGIAGFNIVTSLQKLGHTVPWDSADAPMQFNFCFPSVFVDHLRHSQYQIHLAVWESTKLQPDWYEVLDEVDEIWTASEWCKQIYEDNGFKVVKVFPHGVETMWKPQKRVVNDKVRFLFEGGASRKNAQLVFDAFKTAFGDSNDVELIMKEKYSSDVRKYRSGQIVGLPDGNVKIITKIWEQEQMVQLFHASHVFVSATAGEGFGLPALQSLATGIPTIITEECAPYKRYLFDLGLKSTYIDSPWPEMHPGQVLKPDFDDLVDKLRFTKDNVEQLLPQFHKQAFDVHANYDWLKTTEKAFNDLANRFNNV